MGQKLTRTNVLLLGIDGAGKTTILHKLTGAGGIAEPTMGFNVEAVRRKKVEFNVVDVAGAGTTRGLWRHQYPNQHAVVYVVDAVDKGRIEEATKELETAAKEIDKASLVLVLANKQDVTSAMSAKDLAQQMNLKTILHGRTWNVLSCSGASGQGIDEGLAWIQNPTPADL